MNKSVVNEEWAKSILELPNTEWRDCSWWVNNGWLIYGQGEHDAGELRIASVKLAGSGHSIGWQLRNQFGIVLAAGALVWGENGLEAITAAVQIRLRGRGVYPRVLRRLAQLFGRILGARSQSPGARKAWLRAGAQESKVWDIAQPRLELVAR